MKYSLNEIIEKFKMVFPDYDYSKVDYKSIKHKVCIICNKLDENGNAHGEFHKIPESLISRSSGCPKCSGYYGI